MGEDSFLDAMYEDRTYLSDNDRFDYDEYDFDWDFEEEDDDLTLEDEVYIESQRLAFDDLDVVDGQFFDGGQEVRY